jgi:Leucine-rich repeat (LRR) protein
VGEETLIGLIEEAASTASSRIEIEGDTCEIDRTKRLVGRITALPPQIAKCTELWTLIVRDTDLAELPPELGQLAKLTGLVLPNNKLTELPPTIAGLERLISLQLCGNLLESLPAEIGGLKSLVRLFLRGNRLAALPSSLASLTGLEYLDLRDNLLSNWPRDLCYLPNLETVLLEGNNVSELPREVTRLVKIKEFRLYEGQLTPLPLNLTAKQWDVFISHASEDKESVAAPLADILRRAGLRVWLDRQEITLGDSIRAKIDEGLSQSRFGVILLSPDFLRKTWTQRELGGLMSIEDEGVKVILPVWHHVTKADLARFSPMLADRAAADTSTGIPAVASQIVDVVLYRTPDSPSALFPSLTRRLAQLIANGKDLHSLADFLVQHPKILRSAFGYYSAQGYFTNGVDLMPGDGVPIVAVMAESTLPSRHYVTFASPRGSLFLTNSEPVPALQNCLTRIRELISLDLQRSEQAEIGSLEGILHAGSVILCGRRLEITGADRGQLMKLNATQRAEGLEVRSYDWLLDASNITMNQIA